MSVKKTTLRTAAVAIVASIAIVAASFLYIGIPMPATTSTSSATSQGGQLAPLAIRLTDPPQVPSLTTALNLNYSSIDLLVGEPTATKGQLSTQTVTVTPTHVPATIDLLKLQNVSQTIAIANLPNDSVLYSVSFNVTSISIDVNGTVSPVSLATGTTSFEVTIAHPAAFSAGDFALLQLNPVVVNTPSGYQLIPSSVGIMGHGEGQDRVGDQHQLTNSDNSSLGNARGNVSASITSLALSGNITSFTILVNNSASVTVNLAGIGLHGNFTVVGAECTTYSGQAPYQSPGNGDSGKDPGSSQRQCMIPSHIDEVVFVPSSLANTSSTSCATGQLALVNGPESVSAFHQITIHPGQCVLLSFAGQLTFGEGHFILLPSTSSGQVYVLHVIASAGANQLVTCTLPLGTSSCSAKNQNSEQDSQDW